MGDNVLKKREEDGTKIGLDILIKLKNLPDRPGVYIHKDKDGNVLYVGKAKSLKKRVTWYFRGRKEESSGGDAVYIRKIKRLVGKIRDFDIIVTGTEKEALILENDLIKKYKPPFNVLLKDDKSYPWIVITLEEEFPRVLIIRQPRRSNYYTAHPFSDSRKNLFFGPYVDVKSLRNTLHTIRKIFLYCTCKRKVTTRDRACLYHQIGLCPAPCKGKITREEYMKNISGIIEILKGNIGGLIENFSEKMRHAASELEFEKAAVYRDIITRLKKLADNQTIVDVNFIGDLSCDIIGYHPTLTKAAVLFLHINFGRISGKTPFIIDISDKTGNEWDILKGIIERYYMETSRAIPDLIILPEIKKAADVIGGSRVIPKIVYGDELSGLISYLKEKSGHEVYAVGIHGDNLEEIIENITGGTYPKEDMERTIRFIEGLSEMANNNAGIMLRMEKEYRKLKDDAVILSEHGVTPEETLRMSDEKRNIMLALAGLAEFLGLDKVPRIIEGFDASMWQQKDRVVAMVCFIDGYPAKSNYRNFSIKTSVKSDTGMLMEAIIRRYRRLINSGDVLPDLVVVDGDIRQFKAAEKALGYLKLNIPIIALEKKSNHRELKRLISRYYGKTPVGDRIPGEIIRKDLGEIDNLYKLLKKISDEYHRRAVMYHQKVRKKRIMTNPLEEIPGIGKKTAEVLTDNFGTINDILKKDISDFEKLFGPKKGAKIYRAIHNRFDKK